MQTNRSLPLPTPIIYPDSDGKPLAENTKKLHWIVLLFGNLAALFRDRADVFVAGDNLWYPVEGRPDVTLAPDVYVAFGRPKGHRGSYKQWEEENVPLTVVFEVLSPGNTVTEMDDKHAFYEEYGVEEYYVYDPDKDRLMVFQRKGNVLLRIRPSHGFISPRLGIRFDLSGPEMAVFGPDGKRFISFEDLKSAQEQAEQRATRLAQLGRKARRGQATPEEIRELERLEEQATPPSP